MINFPPKNPIGLVSAKPKILSNDDFLEDLDEVKSLASTLDLEIVFESIQQVQFYSKATLIGQGKVQEIKSLIADKMPNKIIFTNEISPSQTKTLEKIWNIPVVDRVGLVLDIFEQHATTYQAKIQVELAKLKYQLPRLTGLWTHLDRERGGSNVSKGMGERQINIDRHLIRKRITFLQTKLTIIASQKAVQTNKQKTVLKVCLAGYTNVGKSSIMSAITNKKMSSKDQMFTTLDSKTNILNSKFKPTILISDTVGFIRNMPPDLITAFRTTLSSILEADLILHVCDISKLDWEKKIDIAEEFFDKIGASSIPRLLILNKIDQTLPEELFYAAKIYPAATSISSFDLQDIAKLKKIIENAFKQDFIEKNVELDLTDVSLLNFLYENSIVNNIEYSANLINANISIRNKDWQRFLKIN